MGNDLLVGDQFNPFGDANAAGPAGTRISGGGGRDHIVGDNLRHERDAAGGRDDEVCPNKRGPGGGGPNRDMIVGDSEVQRLRHGPRLEANDRICAEKGPDLVVGDSYSPRGTASGRGGNDALNGDYKKDTHRGRQLHEDGGRYPAMVNDRVHGLWGSDLPVTATTSPPAGTGKSRRRRQGRP